MVQWGGEWSSYGTWSCTSDRPSKISSGSKFICLNTWLWSLVHYIVVSVFTILYFVFRWPRPSMPPVIKLETKVKYTSLFGLKLQNIKVIDHFGAEKTPLTISWSKFWVIPFPIFFKFSSSNPSATEWPLEYEMPSVKALQCFHFPPTFKFTTKPQLWLRLKFTKSNPSGHLSTGCPQLTPWSASQCPPPSSSSPWTGTWYSGLYLELELRQNIEIQKW